MQDCLQEDFADCILAGMYLPRNIQIVQSGPESDLSDVSNAWVGKLHVPFRCDHCSAVL